MMARTDPLENHWALAAIERATRERAAAVAARRDVIADESRGGASGALTPEETTAIADVATAYDIAVLESMLATPSAAQIAELAGALRESARRALTYRAALPLETVSREAMPLHRVHLAALSIVADRPETYERWAAALPPPPAEEGIAELRARVADIWVRLLLATELPAVQALTQEIATVRERLTPGARTSPRELFQRQALQALVTAAAELHSYLVRGEQIDVIARVSQRLQAARASAPSDTALAIVVAWLALAAARVAHRRPEQLSLLEARRA